MTEDEMMQDVVKNELTYTLYVKRVADMLGFQLDEDEDYILGQGAASTVYLVSQNNKYFALKFMYGAALGYGDVLVAQNKIQAAGLSRHVPAVVCSYGRNTPTLLRGEVTLPSYGVIVQEYAGITLKEFIPVATPTQLQKLQDN